MPANLEILDGEYVVLPLYQSTKALVAEVRHASRRERQTIFTPVAHLSAFEHPGEDMIHAHWSIHLSVRADVRYERSEHRTTVVSNPERQAGANLQMLNHLKSLRDGNLPSSNTDLPAALGTALTAAKVASEPAMVHVYTSSEESLVEFGAVYEDQDA